MEKIKGDLEKALNEIKISGIIRNISNIEHAHINRYQFGVLHLEYNNDNKIINADIKPTVNFERDRDRDDELRNQGIANRFQKYINKNLDVNGKIAYNNGRTFAYELNKVTKSNTLADTVKEIYHVLVPEINK